MAASSAFDFPQVYEFAPFFTLQPNPTSRSEQLGLWRELILSYCAHHRIFYLDLSPTLPLFNNARISRKLNQESIRQVVADLVANRQAVWEGGNAATATRALIYWRTPVQWANAIYSWVTETGQNKSIMTLFELTQGDLVQGQGMSTAITVLGHWLH